MRTKLAMLLISLMLLTGCASAKTVTYVLDQKEIIHVKTGEPITPAFDGWLLSERAVDRIMNVKIKGVNLQ